MAKYINYFYISYSFYIKIFSNNLRTFRIFRYLIVFIIICTKLNGSCFVYLNILCQILCVSAAIDTDCMNVSSIEKYSRLLSTIVDLPSNHSKPCTVLRNSVCI